MLANGIEEESRKRRKAGSISDYKSAEGYNKENSNPNIVNEDKAIEALKEAIGNNDAHETVDIMSMKVSDLRENLRERGLDTTGLKKDLQNRLQEAIDVSNNENELIDSEKVVKDDLNEEMTEAVIKVNQLTKVQNTKAEEGIIDVDATMEEVAFDQKAGGEEETAETEMDEPIAQSTEHDVEETVSVKENVDNDGFAAVEAEKNQKKPFRALLQNVFSPGKYKSKKGDNSSEISSNLNKMNISDDANRMSVDDEPTEEVVGTCSQKSKHDKRSSMICKMPLDELRVVHHDAKEIEIGGQSTQHVEESLTNVEATPSLSSKKPLNSVSSSSQKNQKKLHEIKEARKQRLDEIRNKVRNFSSVFTFFVVCACVSF